MPEVDSYRPATVPVAQPDLIERRIKNLCANILTIIECSYSDAVQRDAIKILAKKEFNRTLDDLRACNFV